MRPQRTWGARTCGSPSDESSNWSIHWLLSGKSGADSNGGQKYPPSVLDSAIYLIVICRIVTGPSLIASGHMSYGTVPGYAPRARGG